jgi:hypothetical protein
MNAWFEASRSCVAEATRSSTQPKYSRLPVSTRAVGPKFSRRKYCQESTRLYREAMENTKEHGESRTARRRSGIANILSGSLLTAVANLRHSTASRRCSPLCSTLFPTPTTLSCQCHALPRPDDLVLSLHFPSSIIPHCTPIRSRRVALRLRSCLAQR